MTIADAASDGEAKKIYPQGWMAPRPDFRVAPQPHAVVTFREGFVLLHGQSVTTDPPLAPGVRRRFAPKSLVRLDLRLRHRGCRKQNLGDSEKPAYTFG